MRYLGIDYGTKKIGIALSDEAGTMGFPHAVIANTKELLETIAALIKKETVGAVVIGESQNLDGAPNPVATSAHAFGDALSVHTNVPVFYETELFTTQEARRTIDGARGNGREVVDAAAAALILTSYLSRPHDIH